MNWYTVKATSCKFHLAKTQNSYLPAHPCSLITVIPIESLATDIAPSIDEQADLRLSWVNMPNCSFCCALT